MTDFDQTVSKIRRWETTLHAGRRAIEEKDYKEAENLLKKAVEQAGGLENDDPRLAKINRSFGDLFYENKKFETAEKYYKEVINVWETAFGDTYSGLVPVYENYADILGKLRKKDEAKVVAKKLAIINAKPPTWDMRSMS